MGAVRSASRPPTSPSCASPASARSRSPGRRTPPPMLRVTITRVTMEPGATSQRHSHPEVEQTWIVEQGSATLLLVDGKTEAIKAGDVVRTPAGEVRCEEQRD